LSFIPLIYYFKSLKTKSYTKDIPNNRKGFISRFVDYLDIWLCLVVGIIIGYPIALLFYSGMASVKEQINLYYLLIWGRVFLFGIPIIFFVTMIYTGVAKWEKLFADD
jgi:hypothetical protein